MGHTPVSDPKAAPALTAANPLSGPVGGSAGVGPHSGANGAVTTGVGTSEAWTGSEPPPPDHDPIVGVELSGTYQVLRILGEGGMGRVYEAQHTRIPGKRFAIKALHPEFARRKDVLTRFHREVEAAASIDSPYVVGVFDVGETADGRPFFVSELLHGQELGDFLDQRGRTPVPFAVNVVRQICRGLAQAHARGVVHRDMKPENVFLIGDVNAPQVKVIDFGISRLEGQNGNTLTKTGVVMGTPSYMAPEQAKGFRIDHRVDVYAVGAILYRALTGCLPFDRPDATATLAAVLTEEPAPPRSLAPELPQHLELIIQRAMAREPDERYRSMEELEAALAPYDSIEGTSAETSAMRLRPTQASIAHASAQAREVADARPQLLTLGVLTGLAGLAGLLSLIAGLVRVTRSGKPLTGFEALVVLAIIFAALTTPTILLVRHVKKTIWENIARVMEMVTLVRRPALAGVITYGVMAITVRTWESLVARNPTGAGWAWWDLLLPLVSLAAVVITLMAQRTKPGTPSVVDRTSPTTALAGMLSLALVVVFAAFALRGDIGPSAKASTDDKGKDEKKKDDKKEDDKPEKKAGDGPRDQDAAQEAWEKVEEAWKQGDFEAAVKAAEETLRLDPKAVEDKAVFKTLVNLSVKACLGNGPACKPMMTLLTEKSGPAGPDVLFELIATRGGTNAQKRAARLLKDPIVMRGASDALRVAYDLRMARNCSQVEALYERIEKEGDIRAKRELDILHTRQCHARGCCLNRNDPAVKRVKGSLLERAGE